MIWSSSKNHFELLHFWSSLSYSSFMHSLVMGMEMFSLIIRVERRIKKFSVYGSNMVLTINEPSTKLFELFIK